MALLLVIGAQGAMAAENAIYGSWSNYQTKNTVADNKVTVHLNEGKHWFYLWDSNNSSAKFCNSGTMTNTNNRFCYFSSRPE